MKKLTLLRHAKSGWDDPVARDFDRPLNAKGRRASQVMGRFARDEGFDFDLLLASPAVRCVETLEAFATGWGETLAPAWDRRIYLASGTTLLEVVQEADDAADAILMCGHNPGLEDLVLMLVPDQSGDERRDQIEEKFPTASLAELHFAVDRWEEVRSGSATLARFVRPRDVDASLGPDHG